ncbi:MAG: TIM-barrel domain-containing protein [Terracidiphilus sp.]
MRRFRQAYPCALAFAVISLCAHGARAQSQPLSATVVQDRDQVVVKTGRDILRLTVCGPTVVHVVSSPGGTAEGATPQQPWLVGPCEAKHFTLTFPKQKPDHLADFDEDYPYAATLDTGAIKVLISLYTGSLRFTDEQDRRLLQEFPLGPRSYQPVVANGEQLYAVSDLFYPLGEDEALYGLGQHQSGVFNYRGTTVPLAQVNTDVAVPLLVSTRGYGLLWNTAAKSEFDNRFATEMKLSAAAAQAIDYYFVYGPEFDAIVRQYRSMTGHAPMFPEWAYGFIQSKNSYASQDELLKVAGEYRKQHIPIDGIVQDATWWERQGDPAFKLNLYPDVRGALDRLHEQHIHAMVSVWAVFDPKSNNYVEMESKGYIIPGTTDYDPTNSAARDFYWNHHVGQVFAQGWDAFWLDSSEPELGMRDGHSDAVLADKHLAIGNGALYTNIYPLMHAGNVYEHWRNTTESKRVVLLSRSGFAGLQRYGAFIWSGDVYSTYLSLRRQIPAGLNFALSGMPYWTTDIGGYGWPNPPKNTADPEYRKLYLRWFEFGVFCPIFRTHGLRANDTNELYSYGQITPTLIRYDKLRYRLMPYIYSLAWNVTDGDGTIMRPLVMDWRTDDKVWNIGDQFMFGPAILVSPVTEEDAVSRSLYLPAAAGWYDFWTGKMTAGGTRIESPAPLDRIPLYVKAGSIVPLGPDIEYTGEAASNPIELRIYPGADGRFDLYEDAGDGYGYEKNERSVVSIRWDDRARELIFGAREGSFPGMAKQRTFHVVVVRENHGAGPDLTPSIDREIVYQGQAVAMSIP